MPENVNTSALSIDSSEGASFIDSNKTMIKVDNVSMVFNMASEQLNSLKEYAIKLARRELFFEGFTALNDVSFEVKKGDVFGIIGTNGSGKSTMLKIIAGVLEPSEGSCEISGNIAPLIELGAGFDNELSARENIYLNGALLGYSKDFINEHFDEIVDFAEVEKFLDMPLKNYSSGMIARIAFAIATVIVPEILVVDEVLSVGDFMFQKKCEDRISELIEKYEVTVLIVSHSNEQIERLCNKVIWIEKGHTRMIGDASSVCRVYGGLGGRMGSAKSEQRVFEALQHIDDLDDSRCNYSLIAGDNFYGTATRAAVKGWEAERVNTVVLACSNVHVNAIMGSSIAGVYDAPLLPIKIDCIPDIIEQYLISKEPSKIFIVSRDALSNEIVGQAESFSWNPEIVVFSNTANTLDLSIDVYEYGKKKDLWDSTVILAKFQDNIESFATASFASRYRYPIFLVDECNEKEADCICNTFSKHAFTKVVAVGTLADSTVCETLESQGLQVVRLAGSNTNETCMLLAENAFQRAIKKSKEPIELCIASQALGQWPELQACASYCARMDGVLLLEDVTNLDSIAGCLDFVRDRKDHVNSLTFFGNNAVLNEVDRQLLYQESNQCSIGAGCNAQTSCKDTV